MCGKTERTIKRNILDVITDILGVRSAYYNRGTGTFYMKGRPIEVVGANDDRSQEKIRGATIAGIYGDELTLWPENFFKMALSRLSVRGAKLFGTTNPDSPYHWLKSDFLDRENELNLQRFHFELKDNPSLDPEYVAELTKEYTGLWHQRFILGLWVMAEGAIYDMWDASKHTKDVSREILDKTDQKKFRNYFCACDYGTGNPTVFGLFGHNGTLPVYLVKEYYYDSRTQGRQKTDGEYADDYIKFLGSIRPSTIYVDPSAASFIAELRKRKLSVTAAKNDVIDGIRFVSNCLINHDLFIDTSCRETTKEFSGYVWDEKAQKRGEGHTA